MIANPVTLLTEKIQKFSIFKSSIYSITFLALCSILFSLSANATAPSSCESGVHQIFTDYSWYYVDHGMLITVCDDPNIQGGIPVTIKSSVDSTPGLTLTFTESPAHSGRYVFLAGTDSSGSPIQGYVYFTGGPDNTSIPAVNTAMASSSTTLTISVPNVPSQSITSARTDDDPNWPGNLSLAPNQPYLRQTISCTDPSTSGDGLCRNWKPLTAQPASDSIGLSIQFTDTSGLGIPVTYNYYCGPPDPTNNDPTKQFGTYPNPDPVCPLKDQKDIFVELDWLRRHHPDQNALNAVVQSFAQAPTGNGGIKLHIQLSDEIPVHKDLLSVPSAGGALSAVTDFDIIKTWYFGTYDERSSCPGFTSGTSQCSQYITNMLTAKRQAFHYALFAHSQSGHSTSSGSSELPGNDIFVTLGSFTGGVGSIDQLEGTFMHELGHNLGLYHGGEFPSLNPSNDSYLNCKPNYLSVMSYSRQFSTNDPHRSLDYSRGQYASNPLVENSGLNEQTFLPLMHNNDGTPVIIGYATPDVLQPPLNTYLFTKQSGLAPVDYDEDSWLGPFPAQDKTNSLGNINFLRISGCNVAGSTTGTDSNGNPTQIGLVQLNDYNDWANLLLDYKTVSGFYDGASSTTIVGPDRMHHTQFRAGQICNQIFQGDYNKLNGFIHSTGMDRDKNRKMLYDNPVCSIPSNGVESTSNNIMLSQRILNLYLDVNQASDSNFVNGSKPHILHDVSTAYNLANHTLPYSTLSELNQTAYDLQHDVVNATTLGQLQQVHGSVQNSFLINVTPPQSYPDQTWPAPGKWGKFGLVYNAKLGLVNNPSCNPGFQMYSLQHQGASNPKIVCIKVGKPVSWFNIHPAFTLMSGKLGASSSTGVPSPGKLGTVSSGTMVTPAS